MAAKWKIIGDYLTVKNLGDIKHSDIQRCLIDMLANWLNGLFSRGKCSLEVLAQAVGNKPPALNDAFTARKIRRWRKSGEYVTELISTTLMRRQ